MDTLILQYTVAPNGWVELAPEVRYANGRYELGSAVSCGCRYETLVARSEELICNLAATFQVMGACKTESDLAAAQGHMETHRSLGRQLAEDLLPEEVIHQLEHRPSITHLTFRCAPRLNGVPFDHIFLWRDFLGFLYATGKELLSKNWRGAAPVRPEPQLPYRCFTLIDPCRDLPEEVRKEFGGFLENWGGRAAKVFDLDHFSVSRPVTANQVAQAIQASDFVNLVCHHAYNDDSPGLSGYVLAYNGQGGKEVFSALNLIDCLRPGCLPPLLVLSVSCESGITRGWESAWPTDAQVYGMVDAALRVGVRHHIGTLVEIPAHPSGRVLPAFYHALAEAHTVGRALQETRVALRGRRQEVLSGGTALGLALVLYGNPSQGYVPQETARLTGLDVLHPARQASAAAAAAYTVCPAEGSEPLGRLAVLVADAAPRFYEITCPWFFAGRSEQCHVTLPAPGVSSLHATVAQVAGGFIVVDHDSRNGTLVDGAPIRQHALRTGDLLRIGRFWLLFDLPAQQEYRNLVESFNGGPIARGGTGRRVDIAPGRHAAEEEEGLAVGVRLVASEVVASTDSAALLIGSDPACGMNLTGGGIVPFHAVVFWDVSLDADGNVSDGGAFVEDLRSGRGTYHNHQPISHRRVKLADGDLLEVGCHRISVSLFGDVRDRSERLFRDRQPVSSLVLTCVCGPGVGGSAVLAAKEGRLVVGRDECCDLVLVNQGVSGRHTEIRWTSAHPGEATPFSITITDLHSTNGTLLNRTELEPGRPHPLLPGDVVRLSRGSRHSDLLLHYHL